MGGNCIDFQCFSVHRGGEGQVLPLHTTNEFGLELSRVELRCRCCTCSQKTSLSALGPPLIKSPESYENSQQVVILAAPKHCKNSACASSLANRTMQIFNLCILACNKVSVRFRFQFSVFRPLYFAYICFPVVSLLFCSFVSELNCS